MSANVSYQRTAEDVAYLTRMVVPAKTQQRLVHRQDFEPPKVDVPVEEVSVDGGKVRLRTPLLGQPCIWRDYKAIHSEQGVAACFQDNAMLVDWLNHQPLAHPLTCLGDGHDGIWNIVAQIASPGQRREVLDWYHLKENLYKVGGSLKRLKQAEALLWQGQVEATIRLFVNCSLQQAHNFCQYLDKHRYRIINYGYFQSEQICKGWFGSSRIDYQAD